MTFFQPGPFWVNFVYLRRLYKSSSLFLSLRQITWSNSQLKNLRWHVDHPRRISKNVADWNLDGVDFYFDGPQEGQFWVPPSDYECCVYPGNSALYHLAVIKSLRMKYLPSSKTISYTTTHDVTFKCEDYFTCSTIMNTVITAAHPYLDWISFKVPN